MITLDVYNSSGDKVDALQIDEQVFGGKVKHALLRQALIMYEANKHVGLASTKTKSEKRSSNQKLYRQKGTGRARAGRRRSPIRVGGGVAHGPRPRDFRQKLPAKAKKNALCSALLAKMLDGEVIVLDRIQLESQKTREIAQIVKNLGIDGSFLLVTPTYDPILVRCTRNIERSAISEMRSLNARIVIIPKKVVFLRTALESLVEMLLSWKEKGMKNRGPAEAVVKS